MAPDKILQGRCVKPGYFMGETSFSGQFFFNIFDISANTKKPTKYGRFYNLMLMILS